MRLFDYLTEVTMVGKIPTISGFEAINRSDAKKILSGAKDVDPKTLENYMLGNSYIHDDFEFYFYVKSTTGTPVQYAIELVPISDDEGEKEFLSIGFSLKNSGGGISYKERPKGVDIKDLFSKLLIVLKKQSKEYEIKNFAFAGEKDKKDKAGEGARNKMYKRILVANGINKISKEEMDNEEYITFSI